ncbi:MAG: response regulator [Magnetococcales bacterium]|nr:response regulator [Magnetococcales bacterium]
MQRIVAYLDEIVSRAVNWGWGRALLVAVAFAEACTALMVGGMSLLLHGTVRPDFMVTGAVTALVVSLAVLSLFLRLVTMLRRARIADQEGAQAQEMLAGMLAERTAELQKSALNLQAAHRDLTVLNEQITRAADRMPIAYILWDTSFRATEWNPAAERIFGYTRSEALGHTPLELFVPDDAHVPVAAAMAELLAGGEAHYSAPGNNITKEGRIISCLWFNAPLKEESGRVHGVLSMALEVTEREEMERALRVAKEQAEAANHAKTRFLAMMSHDMRTPLNVILGMSELLATTPLHEEQQQHLTTLTHAGESLLALINDILDLSKIEAGQLSLELVPLDLGRLVARVIDILALNARQKGINLRWQGSELPRQVTGDWQRLQQVLLNLVGNAIKFTHQGEVVLRVEAAAGDRFRFTITDTGIGIPPAEQEKIFLPFTQVGPTISHRFGGTGLGLTICRLLVEKMGGEIGVESTPGVGSRFHVVVPLPMVGESTLPLVFPQKSARDDAATPPRAIANLSVLLVDDSIDNCQLMRSFLREITGHFDTAENGRVGVEKAMAETFDLIIMDVQMPVMDGYEATRRIRAHQREHGLGRTPIIALTANAMKEDADLAIAAGCDLYLTKPIRKKRLLEGITALLS